MEELLLAIVSGLVAGTVHVLSGPDHLAAVLPFAVRDRFGAVRAGVVWGVGHGLGVLVLAALALIVRAELDVDRLSSFAELLVGAMLIVVGMWSLRQSRVILVHTHEHHHHHEGGEEAHVHHHVHVGETKQHTPARHARHHHSILGFGLLHGLAGAGHLLGVLPSLALGKSAAIAYLGAFLFGGLGAMAAFAYAAGHVVRHETWRPRGFALAGVTSIVVGAFWLVHGA